MRNLERQNNLSKSQNIYLKLKKKKMTKSAFIIFL